MIQNRETLKEAFESKKFPNEQDYSNLIDSYVHKTDRYSTQADLIEYEGVEGEIAQHIGKSTETFVNGYFYKKSNGQWQRINVQPTKIMPELDDEVSESSSNAVKSSGIYNALNAKLDGTSGAGDKSSQLGLGTIAKGAYQVVLGRYNVIDNENKYALIVGNGTSDTDRSNAYTVDWNGNIEFNDLSYVKNFGNVSGIQATADASNATEQNVLYIITENNGN